jgi:hypothetical protein
MPVVMMVMMSAGAGFAVLVVVMMLFVLILVMVVMIMMVMMLMVVVVIIIVVMVTAAARAHAVLVVMVIMVVVVMMMLVFVLVVVIIVVIEVDFHRLAGFNDFQQRISGQVIPRRRHDADTRMLFFHQRAALLDALRGQQLRTAENHRRARLNLVEEELAEVLHIHAALARVHNGRAAGHNEVAVAFLRALDGSEDFAQLAHAGRLNQQAVRMILRNQVINRLLEVAHQRAADAAGIQLINDDARILHKAAVHADFAIFIFQQDDFFLRNAARQQLFDERRFARAQKTRNNVDLNHSRFSPIPQGLAAHSRHAVRNTIPGFICAICLRLFPSGVRSFHLA